MFPRRNRGARRRLGLLLSTTVGLSQAACSFNDCGTCVQNEALGASCRWCAIDSACHVASSPENHCTASMEITSATPGGCAARLVPEQLHVALASSGGVDAAFDGMAVSWSTGLRAEAPAVFWSTAPGVVAGASGVTAVGAERTSHVLANYHHHAAITGLPPSTAVYYRVGHNGTAESAEWSFRTAPADPGTASASASADASPSFRVSVFGDLAYGAKGNAVASRRRLEALKDDPVTDYDLVWHLGDIAYADDSFLHAEASFTYEARYNAFMNDLQNVSATRPYMVLPGNHESECHSPACLTSPTFVHALSNFSGYNARWRMPARESGGAGAQMWSSFNYGLAHFVSWNSETDFPNAAEEKHGDTGILPAGGFAPDGELLRWLEADLAAADANRAARPWILVGSHRQLYLPPGGVSNPEVVAAVEELFKKYKVDAHFSGHEHNYGRTYPMYQGERSSNDTAALFVDPATPFYVVAGGAGCDEGLDDTVVVDSQHSTTIDPANPGLEFASARTRRAVAGDDGAGGEKKQKPTPKDWAAFIDTTNYGTGILTVTNRTHLRWDYISSATGEVLDTFTVVQHAHA